MLPAAYSLSKKVIMRSKEIKESYIKHQGLWSDESTLFAIGNQLAYEWEEDFKAMKWALCRIDEFLKVAKEKGFFTGTLDIAKEELVNRISKYSCPSNLKDQFKTKDNCPLGEKCKCCEMSCK
jgi:hypothetical protein